MILQYFFNHVSKLHWTNIWSHVQFVHAKTKIEHGTFVLLNVFFYFLFFSCYIIGFTFALMPKLMCQS